MPGADPRFAMVPPIGYRVRIRVQGELSANWWSGLFAALTVAAQPDGTTLLTGNLPDQAALHGLLTTIRDTGLSLISVETAAADTTTSQPEPAALGDSKE